MSRQAKYWGLGAAIVLLVATGLVWRGSSIANEEGQRLLRRAKEAGQAPAASARLKIMPAGRLALARPLVGDHGLAAASPWIAQ
jgi:hypothetical protein